MRVQGVGVYEIAALVVCGEFAVLEKEQALLAHKNGQPIMDLFRVYAWREHLASKFFIFGYARSAFVYKMEYSVTPDLGQCFKFLRIHK